MAARGCGYRVPGAIYATMGVSPGGTRRVEDFLLCPPKPLPEAFISAQGIEPLGVKLIRNPKTGTVDVWDWVGQEHYPNVADFVEEARRLGVSRKLSSKLQFDLLGPDSRLILIHARAQIDNALAFYLEEHDAMPECPKGHAEHARDAAYTGMCARLYWQDVIDAGVPVTASGVNLDERAREREMPAFDYLCWNWPEDVAPVYGQPAIFGTFPIPSLQVIRSDDGKSELNAELAGMSGIDVELADE